MKLVLLLVALTAVYTANCRYQDSTGEDQLFPNEQVDDTSLGETQRVPIGPENQNIDEEVQQMKENYEMGSVSDHRSSMTKERKRCIPTISCTSAGGHCVKKSGDCKGTVDRYGCRGSKKCRCCIPDDIICIPVQTTAAPTTTRDTTTTTTPTTTTAAPTTTTTDTTSTTTPTTTTAAPTTTTTDTTTTTTPTTTTASTTTTTTDTTTTTTTPTTTTVATTTTTTDTTTTTTPTTTTAATTTTTTDTTTTTTPTTTTAALTTTTTDTTTTTAPTTTTAEPTTTPPDITCPDTKVDAGQDLVCSRRSGNTWQQAYDYCTSIGLTLAQPKDVLIVATKLVESSVNGWYWIGGNGTGTYQRWLNGTDLDSSISAWQSGYPLTSTSDCLVLWSTSSSIRDGMVLRTQPCTASNGYILCDSPKSGCNVTWLSVGADRFVSFHMQKMNWADARDVCKQHCLDLYEPKDALAVSQFLDDTFSIGSSSEHWLGGRGNGTHQIWFSGNVVPADAPWFSGQQNSVATNDCMFLHAHNADTGRVLGGFSCSYSSAMRPLCG